MDAFNETMLNNWVPQVTPPQINGYPSIFGLSPSPAVSDFAAGSSELTDAPPATPGSSNTIPDAAKMQEHMLLPQIVGHQLSAAVLNTDSTVSQVDMARVLALGNALLYGALPKSGSGNIPHNDEKVRYILALVVMRAADGVAPKNADEVADMFNAEFPDMDLIEKTIRQRLMAMTKGRGAQMTFSQFKSLCRDPWFQGLASRVRDSVPEQAEGPQPEWPGSPADQPQNEPHGVSGMGPQDWMDFPADEPQDWMDLLANAFDD